MKIRIKLDLTLFDFTEIKRWCRIVFDYIVFLFSRPKYKVGQKIKLYERFKKNKIINIKRCWDLYCPHFYYELDDESDIVYSEDLLTFYLEK
jgi:hypothetical protein